VNLQYTRDFQAATQPDFRFQVRRISLSQRLRFLADNHDLMQTLKFLAAGQNSSSQERIESVRLELELSLKLLTQCLVSIDSENGLIPVGETQIQWLLNDAPTELCVEVLACISEEISLSEQRRKN